MLQSDSVDATVTVRLHVSRGTGGCEAGFSSPGRLVLSSLMGAATRQVMNVNSMHFTMHMLVRVTSSQLQKWQ